MDGISPGNQKEWVLDVLKQYERPLLRFAWRLTGDEQSARDVVQHAFLRLCGQSRETIGERAAAWLFAVCRNLSIDLLRKRSVAAEESGYALADCPGKEPDPAAMAEKTDMHRHINRMLDALPLPQREAVALWAEGFTYREIADVTKNTEGNIRVIVHRALKRLRKLAEQVFSFSPEPTATGRARAAAQKCSPLPPSPLAPG
jgi:RNA polymerase sigma factor (sigma-70 family)